MLVQTRRSHAKFYLQDYSRLVHCCLVSIDQTFLSEHRAPPDRHLESGDANCCNDQNVAVPLHVNGWLFCHLLNACLDNPTLRQRFVRRLRRRPVIVFVLHPPQLEYIDYKWYLWGFIKYLVLFFFFFATPSFSWDEKQSYICLHYITFSYAHIFINALQLLNWQISS